MSWKHLGETFDIHGGGIDLVFPHHENEIAQSRCAFHSQVMANYWMHNGFLQVEGEKMSKSLGNFFAIHELLTDWPGEVRALQHAAHALSPADRLDRRGPRRKLEDGTDDLVTRVVGDAAGGRISPQCPPRSTTISTASGYHHSARAFVNRRRPAMVPRRLAASLTCSGFSTRAQRNGQRAISQRERRCRPRCSH